MNKSLIAASSLLSLIAPVSSALAYPPPCARGDLYVGGASYAEADCIERRFLKEEMNQPLMNRTEARGNVTSDTRRSRIEEIRTVNLNPTARRAIVGGLVKVRNVRERIHAVKQTVRSVNLRAFEGSRLHGSAERRRDVRPSAEWSRRTKVNVENATPLHGGNQQ